MRFFKKRQSDMLNGVAFLLQKEKETVAGKVPALKDFIEEFNEKHIHLQKLVNRNPSEVKTETLQKQLTKDAFAEITLSLCNVVRAANSKSRNKEVKEIHYTLWSLRKMPAAKLCAVYTDAINKVKKIRNLSYYGLSHDNIKDAQAYSKEFAAKKNAPGKRKKQEAAKNKQLNDAIKECIDLLVNSIDPLMMLATQENGTLRNDYKAVRKVLAKGQGRPSDAEAAYRKSRRPKKRMDN